EWVQTRVGEEGKPEVRLRTFEEFRPLFEKPGEFLMIESEEVSAGMQKVPVHINAINVAEAIQPIKDLATVKDVLRANMQAIAEHAIKHGRPVMAHLNHPNFRWALTAEDLAHVVEDKFFEV